MNIDPGALIACGLVFIEYTAAQGSGNTDHTIELVLADKSCPLLRKVLLVLRRDDIARGNMNTVLIEEQTDNFMAACQRCLGKAQGSTGGGGMGR